MSELDQLWEQGTEVNENWSPVEPFDEQGFQGWYQGWANKTGINPDPDDPRHKYDYRAAYTAGAEPAIADDGAYHWPSEHKADDHPNRYVDGMDTKTGMPLQTGMPSIMGGVEPVPDDLWDQGVEVDQNFEPTGASKARQLEEMGTAGKIWEAGKTAGSQAYTLFADILPGTIWRGLRGGDDELEETWLDRQISQNEAERERRRSLSPEEREVTAFRIPFTDIDVKFGDFEDIADNLGYSLGNAIAMAGSRMATKAALGQIPYVGKVGSAIIEPAVGAVSATAFTARVTKDQFIDDLKKEWLKAHKGQILTPELQRQWKDYYEQIASDATIYGLWEAVPETASNMIGWGIAKFGSGKTAQAVSGAVKKKLTNKIGKMIAKKLGIPVAKLGAMWTEELITEMITTKKQSELEFARGLREKPLGWIEALKEVAPAVMLSTPLMAAGFKGANKIAEGAANIGVKEVKEDELVDLDETEKPPPLPGAKAEDIESSPLIKRMKEDYAAGRITDEDIAEMREGMDEKHPLYKALDSVYAEEAPALEEQDLDKQQAAAEESLIKLMQNEYPDSDIAVQVVAKPENKNLQAAQTVGEALGVNVVVFRGEREADSFNGLYHNGTIYVNENAERPYLVTIGHESWHKIETEHPDLAKKLVDILKDKDLGFEKYIEGLNADRVNAGLEEISMEDALGRQEFRADFVGDQFANVEFWKKLKGKDQDMAYRLATIVKELIETVRAALRKAKMVPAAAHKDINDAQDALASVYSEFARREKKVADETAAPVAGKKKGPVKITATESEGEGGVTRLTYTNEAGDEVGTARLMGNTIGDIEVEDDYRRQGIGAQILEDLKSRGATSGFAGSEAGAKLMEKGGLKKTGKTGHYAMEAKAPPQKTIKAGNTEAAVTDWEAMPPDMHLKRLWSALPKDRQEKLADAIGDEKRSTESKIDLVNQELEKMREEGNANMAKVAREAKEAKAARNKELETVTEPYLMALDEYRKKYPKESTSVPPDSVLAMHPENITYSAIKDKPNKDLEAMSIVLGISKSGTKKVKAKRISRVMDIRRRISKDTVESLIERESVESLKDIARVLGLGVTPGTKMGLATSIINWRTRSQHMGRAAIAEAKHYNIVKDALAAGKKVPDFVLDRYPDLINETKHSVKSPAEDPFVLPEELEEFWSDADGHPIKMYHGTSADFDELTPGPDGAIYLTADPSYASQYAASGEMVNPRVYPVYAKVNNVFDIEDDDHLDILESVAARLKKSVSYAEQTREIDFEDTEWIIPEIKKLGYDGIVVSEEGADYGLGVFDKGQIISAVSAPKFSLKSPEFKKWFGDSKVVDENGDPLVVYHSTYYDFDTFNTRRSTADNRMGSYFTESQEYSNRFASSGGRTIPAYLKIKKPLDLSNIDERDYEGIAAAIPGLSQDAKTAVARGRWRGGMYTVLEGLDAEYNLVPKLKKKGFDGIVFPHSTEGKTYVVFKPDQVQSAFNAEPEKAPKFSVKEREGAKRLGEILQRVPAMNEGQRKAAARIVRTDEFSPAEKANLIEMIMSADDPTVELPSRAAMLASIKKVKPRKSVTGFESEAKIARDRLNSLQKKGPIDFEDAEVLNDVIALSDDKITGYKESRVGDARYNTVSRAIKFTEENNDIPANYIEMDLRNLGGINSAFGHSKANDIYRAQADIVKRALLDLDGADVDLFRHGGDEMSAVVVGATREQVDAAMVKAAAAIGRWARRTKTPSGKPLSELPHPKYKGDKAKAGVGVIFSSMPIEPAATPEIIFQVADTALEQKKEGFEDELIQPTEQTRAGAFGGQEAKTEGRARYTAKEAGAGTRSPARGVRQEPTQDQVEEVAKKFTEVESEPMGIGGVNLPANALPPGSQRVVATTTGHIKGSGIMVRNEDDAASLLAPLRKSAQELAYTITTDSRGKILEIHRYSKGARASALISPLEIAGRIVNVPGAAKAYFAHNHPTGKTELSEEDKNISRTIADLVKLKGIDLTAFTIGGTKYRTLKFNNEYGDPVEVVDRPIKPISRKKKLPTKERKLLKRPGERLSLGNPNELLEVAEIYNHQDGIFLTDGKLKVLDFIPFSELKEGKQSETIAKGVAKILSKAERSNAGAMIAYMTRPLSEYPNRGEFLRAISDIDIGLVEVFHGGRSSVEFGEMEPYKKYPKKTPDQYGAPNVRLYKDQSFFSVKGPREDIAQRYSLKRKLIDDTIDRGLMKPEGVRIAALVDQWAEVDKMLRLGYSPYPQHNMANVNKRIRSSKKLRNTIEALEKESGFKILEDGKLTAHPIEMMTKRSKVDTRAVKKGQIAPLYVGFWRTFVNEYFDKMPTEERESFRKSVVKTVEKGFKEGSKGLSLGGVAKSEYRISPVLGPAHKTVGTLNFNSMCPMYMIGAHGCYLDGCYVTGQAKSGQGTPLYRSAMYVGDILQLNDDSIAALNNVGGLRINGQGDTQMEDLPQWEDVIRHAHMRGLRLKVITKQDATMAIMDELARRNVPGAKNVIIQPTIDPYWLPVEFDNIKGSAVDAMQIYKTVEKGNLEAAANMYALLGREAKIINGKLYRKYGYSWDRVQEMAKKYPHLQIQPRLVVATPREIAEYALKTPKAIQTWMHAKLRPGMYSEVEDGVLGVDVEPKNFMRRIAIAKVGGKWKIMAQAHKGDVRGRENRAYTETEKWIKDNFTEKQADKIFTTLAGQIEQTPSALCCTIGASQDACNDCTSHCNQGTFYTGKRLARVAEAGGKVTSEAVKAATKYSPAWKASVKQSEWYSQARNVMEKKLPGSGPAANMKQTIEGLMRKGEMKAEEVEWSGVLDWLDGQTGKVSKDEVLGYMEDNKVELKDVILGSDGGEPIDYELEDPIDWPKEGTYIEPSQDYIDERVEFYMEEDGLDEQEALDRAYDSMDEDYVYEDREYGYRIFVTYFDGSAEDFYLKGPNDEDIGYYESWDLADDAAEEHATKLYGRPVYDEDTQYGQYTVKGGKDYAELLMIMAPDTKARRIREFNNKIKNRLGIEDWQESQLTSDESNELKAINALPYDKTFRSSHWNDRNVLTHVRFDARNDLDGNKMLFIEEVQSDWHQEGRKFGYSGKAVIKKVGTVKEFSQDEFNKKFPHWPIDFMKEVGDADPDLFDLMSNKEALRVLDAKARDDKKLGDDAPVWVVMDENGKAVSATMLGKGVAESVANQYHAINPTTGKPYLDQDGVSYRRFKNKKLAEIHHNQYAQDLTPDAPFKKTGAWAMLGFKRAVRWAIDNGYDSIGWTTGEQQAERYDLSKRIKKLILVKSPVSESVKLYAYDHNGRQVINETLDNDEAVEEYVGKEMAQKLIDAESVKQPNGTYERALEGLDLKVGGEGMKGFYDKILPSEVKKFFGKKTWGKPRIAPARINTEESVRWKIIGRRPNINEWGAYSKYYPSEEIAKAELRIMERSNDGWEFKAFPDPDALEEVWSLPITEQMREKVANEGLPLFSVKTDSPWYSQMADVLATKLPNKGTAEQMEIAIRSYAGKGDFKAEELEWSGLEAWLEDHKENVSRQQVLDFLSSNAVKVDEVVYSQSREEYAGLYVEQGDEEDEWHVINDVDGDIVNTFSTEAGANEFIDNQADSVNESESQMIAEWAADAREIMDDLESKGYEIEMTPDIDTGEPAPSRVLWDSAMSAVDFPLVDGIDSEALDELPKDDDDSIRLLDRRVQQIRTAGNAGVTKYPSYVQPGGKNYRELLLQVHPKPIGPQHMMSIIVDPETTYQDIKGGPVVIVRGKRMAWKDAVREYHPTPPDMMDTFIEFLDKMRESTGSYQFGEFVKNNIVPEIRVALGATEVAPQPFRGGHWNDVDDVLAHVRFDERIDADGKRSLHIAEIQSDWHQKGRKEGYKQTQRQIGRDLRGAEMVERDDGLYDVVRNGETIYQGFEEANARLAIENLGNGPAMEAEGVPDAPFKKTWHMLAFKRMVRWAAENGFDQVTWDPGEVQADRYDLSDKVDRIEYKLNDDGTADYTVFGRNRADSVMEGEGDSKQKVADTLGKEIADNMFSDAGIEDEFFQEGYKALIDENLKVGGEGMKAFYDRMLVNEVNKFFNKKAWGHAKVGKTTIDTTTGLTAPRKYVGPVRTVGEMKAIADNIETTATVARQLREIIDKISAGTAFQDAANQTSELVAETLGGRLEMGTILNEVWSLPVTPEIKSKVLQRGMPLFSVKKMSSVAKDYLEALQAAYPDAFKPAPHDMAEDPFEGLSEEIRERMEAAKGIPVPRFVDWLKKQSQELWWSMRRHRPYLDPRDQAELANVLRIHQEVPENSKRRTMQVLNALIAGMKPKHYQTFSLFLIMEDMIKDIDDGLLANKEELPFGFTEEQARAYHDRLKQLVQASPVVEDAIRRRKTFQKKLRRALVRADLLPESVLEDDRYFHHQVLEYRAAEALGEAYGGLGVSSRDVRLKRKGWQRARSGSVKDYNIDYAEAEFEVISQGLSQLETKETMDRIKGLVDETPGLKMQAKSLNLQHLYEEEAKRLTKLNPKDPAWTPEQVREEADPLAPYKHKMAMGLSWLGRLAKKGELASGTQDFTDVIEGLREWQREIAIEKAEAKEDGRKPYPIPFPFEEVGSRFWAFLNHVMREDLDGAPAAGTIFKAIRERNQFIKDFLGDKFLTAVDLKPADHVLWKPAPGSSWYKAWTLTDRLVQAVQEGEQVIGKAELEKAHQILAKGKDVEWIVPADVAKTLDGFDIVLDDHKLSKASRAVMTGWKGYILINPFRVIKYNVNNMSGDLDITLAYDPKIALKYMPAAVKDLWSDFKLKKLSRETRAEIDRAYTLGVLGSGWSIQEIKDVNRQLSFDKQMEALQGAKPNLIKRGWRSLSAYTGFRENMLRLAAYRYFLDELRAGEQVYAASNKKEVDGIRDIEEKAAKLARELIGDYGNISHAGQWLRRHIMPFYAWMEVNAPRYVRLMRNLPHEGKGRAGLGGVLAAKVAWKGTKLGIKASAIYALITLWNHTFFSDEEDELGESQRRQLHLILGRRDDGSIITLRLQGALSDALSWFGGEDLPSDIMDVVKGKATIWDKTKEAALAPVVKTINAVRPDVKAFSELLGGRTFYPDPFNPRPVRDKLEHIARSFSLNGVYRWLAGKPKRGDNWSAQLANDLLAIGTYTSDPGESAYYDTLSMVYDFLEKNGRERASGVPTNRSNALYYYKQALKYGDLKAAEKYLKKYYELGGIDTGIDQSIKRADPLAPLPADWRSLFIQSLSEDEKARFQLAMRWYEKTYKQGRGKVRVDQTKITRPPSSPTIRQPAKRMNLRSANQLKRGVQ